MGSLKISSSRNCLRIIDISGKVQGAFLRMRRKSSVLINCCRIILKEKYNHIKDLVLILSLILKKPRKSYLQMLAGRKYILAKQDHGIIHEHLPFGGTTTLSSPGTLCRDYLKRCRGRLHFKNRGSSSNFKKKMA